LSENVVDPGSGSDDGSALRACLRFVEGWASTFECDIPEEPSDPPEVAQAAATMRRVARRSGERPPATGVLPADDSLVWNAFVTFAPHALDGSVWSSGAGGPVVIFADQGASIVVRVDPDQARRLSDLVAPGQLVPIKEWRRGRPIGTVFVRLVGQHGGARTDLSQAQ
jgi:hypothetical protein